MQPLDLAGITFNPINTTFAGGTTTTLLTTVAGTPVINGKFHTLAAVANVQPATTDANTGAAPVAINPGYGSVFVVGALRPAADTTIACSTTLGWVQGEIVPIAASASATDYVPGAFITAPEFPSIPDGFCPIGYITCRVASTQAAAYTMFTTGTTVTGAQNGNTAAFANLFRSICALPARPQIA